MAKKFTRNCTEPTTVDLENLRNLSLNNSKIHHHPRIPRSPLKYEKNNSRV